MGSDGQHAGTDEAMTEHALDDRSDDDGADARPRVGMKRLQPYRIAPPTDSAVPTPATVRARRVPAVGDFRTAEVCGAFMIRGCRLRCLLPSCSRRLGPLCQGRVRQPDVSASL
jgi:hypothetical protein